MVPVFFFSESDAKLDRKFQLEVLWRAAPSIHLNLSWETHQRIMLRSSIWD